MLIKRMNIFRRQVKTWPGRKFNDETHAENVVRESWWLFGVIPIYVRETTNARF